MEQYMRIPIKCLSLMGHNMERKESCRSKKSSQVVFVILVSALGSLLYYTISHVDDIPLMTGSLCVAFTCALSIVKIATFFLSKDKFFRILRTIKEMLRRDDTAERDCLHRANRMANLLVQSYTMTATCTGLYFVLLPGLKFMYSKVTNGNFTRELPMKMKFPFDSLASPMYELVILYSAASIFFVVVYVVAVDGMFVSFTFNICGHFEIIQKGMESCPFSKKNCNAQAYLTSFVQYHDNLLNIAKDVRSAYRPIIFTQFLVTSLQICVIVYQFVINLGNFLDMIVYVIFFVAIMIQLFIYCYGGEIVKIKSNKIGNSVYLSDWYLLPVQHRSTIALIILRAQRNIIMYAGLYEATLESFMMIVKAAMSYIAIIQSLEKME